MSTSSKPSRPPRESTTYLTSGLAIGAMGTLGAVAGAAACPVCVVAAPALLTFGLYKRWKETRQASTITGPKDSGSTGQCLDAAKTR